MAKNCPEGVYCDPDTNLMWTIEDNGKDITGRGKPILQEPQLWRVIRIGDCPRSTNWKSSTIPKTQAIQNPETVPTDQLLPVEFDEARLGFRVVLPLPDGGRYVGPMDDSGVTRALCVRRSGK